MKFFITVFNILFIVVILHANEKTLIYQDVSLLKNNDGKIVEQEEIPLFSPWNTYIESYKIRYLSDGLKVVGFIIKPKEENIKYPVVIYNRGGIGEEGKISNDELNYINNLAYERKYVIIASQYRGNDGGEGKEEYGGKDIDDVLNLILLSKSLNFTDPNRIFMYGGSRGGMMTYLAIKHGADIKAAAVVSGISDCKEFYYKSNNDTQNAIEQSVGFNDNDYIERSACYWPEKINVPIIILHGAKDHIVNVNQAKNIADKLKKLNKIYKLYIFPNGDHGIHTNPRERDNMIFRWFEKYSNK